MNMNFWDRFRNRFSFRPNDKRKEVSDIDLDYWKNILGIKLILIDCDNTICEYGKDNVPEDIANWVREAKNKDFKIIIFSNNKERRVKPIAETLNVEHIASAYKFLGRSLKLVMKKNKVDPKQTLVIGDQILMDIIPGNIVGAYTILVEPLSPEDSFLTRIFSRRLEKRFQRSGFRG